MKGKFSFSKSIRILPLVRVRYNLNSGFSVVIGGGGLNYTIPLGKPKLPIFKGEQYESLTSNASEPTGTGGGSDASGNEEP